MRTSRLPATGFTLAEISAVIAVIAILFARGIPAWQDSVKRTAAETAVASLQAWRMRMDQFQVVNQHYGNGACGVGPPSSTSRFAYSCALKSGGQGFALAATGVAGSLNGGFGYSLDESGRQATLSLPPDWGQPDSRCWILRIKEAC